MTINERKFPTLAKLADRQEKRIEKFQKESSKVFHPHAVTLCRRIKKGIPQFTGCELAMRMLFLEPRDLQIPLTNSDGEKGTERLQNIMRYLTDPSDDWVIHLPQDTINALIELDELATYIDDNCSNVSELYVNFQKSH